MNMNTYFSKIGFSLRIISAMAMLVGATQLATPVWAESAPVFDADAMSQSFDQPTEPPQEYPMPQDSTFVPMQPEPIAGPPQQSADRSNMPLQQRIKKIEQQLANMQNSESSARIESLQSQVQGLRGQVEHMLRVFEQIQEQQNKSFTDFEKRLSDLSAAIGKPSAAPNLTSAAPASTVTSAAATSDANTKLNKTLAAKTPAATTATNATPQEVKPSQPNVAEEQQIYQTAYNLIKNKKYNDAVSVLQNMLQKYPTGQFASNAHYWLGELYGLLGKNQQALQEFDTVVRNYPDSPRVSDAQLKVGLIYAAEFKWPEAKQNLRKVINRYPGTTSARLASEQLKQIKQAGH